MVHVRIDEFSTYLNSYNYTAYLSDRDWRYEYIRRCSEFERAAWEGVSNAPKARVACHDISVMRISKRDLDAEKWGLRFFPTPDRAAPKVPVFWTEEVDPQVVNVSVLPRNENEPHDLFETTIKRCKMFHLTDQNGAEHLVHVGPGSSVQVRCWGHTLLTSRPVKTSFSVDAIEGLETHLDTVRRATQVYGRHIQDPPIFSRKARLLRNGLIALDGRRAELSDRQIASIIEGDRLVHDACAIGDRSLVNRVKYYRDRAIDLCARIQSGVPTPDLFKHDACLN